MGLSKGCCDDSNYDAYPDASANRSVRHGTCFRRRLSAHHAGAAPHSAVAELGVVRSMRTPRFIAALVVLFVVLSILQGFCWRWRPPPGWHPAWWQFHGWATFGM